jgi:hypothetical protein
MDTYASHTDVLHEQQGFAYACGIPGYDAGEHCYCLRTDETTQVCFSVHLLTPIDNANIVQSSWGCFRLTDPPGKQVILNCNKPGIFHPHDVDNIYTEALKPGHVVELAQAPLEVIDMRPRK